MASETQYIKNAVSFTPDEVQASQDQEARLHNSNLSALQDELARPNLHPTVKATLQGEYDRLVAQGGGSATRQLKPFTGELEDTGTKLKPFTGELVDDSSPSAPFQSGSAFKDTKDLIPSMGDIKGALGTFKKQWTERNNTPMTAEVANKMMADEHSVGSAVLDTLGALPAMAVGGVHGILSGIGNLDATKGLKTASETMSNLLPSSLLGNKEDQKMEGYNAGMAPFTAVMDTLNAVPQGYGEILNAAGAPNAAAQVTDAGKLAIMATVGAKGVHEAYKGLTGADARAKAAAEETARRMAPPLKPFTGELDQTSFDFTNADKANTRLQVGKVQDELASQEPALQQQQLAEQQRLHDQAQAELAGINSDHQRLADQQSGQGDLFGQEAYPNGVPFDEPSLADRPADSAVTKEAAPTVEFPLRSEVIDADNNITAMREAVAAQDKAVNDLRDSGASPESVALEQTKENDLRQQFGDYMDQNYGIKQGSDAYKALFESGKGETALPIQKVFDPRTFKDLYEAKAGEIPAKMSMEHTANLFQLTKAGDLVGAIKYIADNHTNPMYRALAKFLSDKIDGIKLAYHEGPLKVGDKHANGYFDNATNQVGLSTTGAMSPHVILHEVVHALTSQYLNTKPGAFLSRGMDSLYNQVKAAKGSEAFKSIYNTKEFVAEALSNTKFQEFLKTLPASPWAKFKNLVKNMLGLTEGKMENALDQVMDLSKKVMDKSTFDFRTKAAEQMKAAGVPNKLADLMATGAKEDIPNARNPLDQIPKVGGIDKIAKQFSFFRNADEAINLAKSVPDMTASTLDKVAQNLRSGALFESLRHNNPVVKWAFEQMQRGEQETARWVKENITNPKDGLRTVMRRLTNREAGEVWSAMMQAEGQRELTTQELRNRGFNDNQLVMHAKFLDVMKKTWEDTNKTRVAKGMEPMDWRLGHIAGRFMGDFSHMIYEKVLDSKTGKMVRGELVGRISGNMNVLPGWQKLRPELLKGDLQRAREFIQQQHPNWEIGELEYKKIGKSTNTSDRFGGFMEALNFAGKTNENLAKLLNTLKEYTAQDATKYQNAIRHAKDKKVQAGGLMGSEGNKAWKGVEENAREGMRAQLDYAEGASKWNSTNRAVGEVNKVLDHPDVIENQPNAVKWAKSYLDQSLGRGNGVIGDLGNAILSSIGEHTGIGGTAIVKANAAVKSYTLQTWMGLANIPFTVQHLLIPLQQHPAMVAYLKHSGIESSAAIAQVKSAHTFLQEILHDGKLSPDERAMVNYFHDNGVSNVSLADQNRSVNIGPKQEKLSKLMSLDFTGPEHVIRANAFFFYSHLLKDAGMPLDQAMSAAENMVKFTMTDYGPMAAPKMFTKGGWIGSIAGTLTRYKLNQFSQREFYLHQGMDAVKNGDPFEKLSGMAPLTIHLGTALALGGVLGFVGMKHWDELYSEFSKWVLKKPDNIQALLTRNNVPEAIQRGVFSFAGVDAHTHFNESEIVPPALIPYANSNSNMLSALGHGLWYHDKQSVKDLAMAFTTQSLRGPLENFAFTGPKETSGPNAGKSMYLNPNDMTGRYARTDDEKSLRNYGTRSIKEAHEVDNTYSEKRIEQDKKDLAAHIVELGIRDINNGTLTKEKLAQYAKDGVAQGMPPDALVSQLNQHVIGQKLSQAQRLQLQNAQGGLGGAQNLQRMKEFH